MAHPMTDMTDNKDESRLDANQHSNLYTDAEWNPIKHAVERYTRIKSVIFTGTEPSGYKSSALLW